eukprot:12218080-Prorocentrum_lima.AAC.1
MDVGFALRGCRLTPRRGALQIVCCIPGQHGDARRHAPLAITASMWSGGCSRLGWFRAAALRRRR